MKNTLVLGFPEYDDAARRLAKASDADYQLIEIHHFPDGESLVRLPPDRLPSQVIFCRSLDRPNDKLVELMLAAESARNRGVRQITLVVPYLCYMRQDKAFRPGEAVSQHIIGKWLAGLFDKIITVDPHLHRTPELGLALPQTEAISLSATSLLGDFLKQQVNDALLVGPDEESAQWVQQIANAAGFPFVVAKKQRQGDRRVEIKLPAFDYAGKSVVLVDDVVSTGQTMLTAARQLKSVGAAEVHCLVTHPVFCDEATELFKSAGVDNLWSSDSIPHVTNVVQLASLLAEAVTQEQK
ncbi:MAG TPA: ribose-phosphate diphosphokinase [Chromatiales bacterium]|nr:ribose-phosphate diphosphokinase [Thiotrichales bacterium]HIP68662.1 ribose-phosphate diphosphokinase [Chromatiales bacterium]